jgi:hypothetical protein
MSLWDKLFRWGGDRATVSKSNTRGIQEARQARKQSEADREIIIAKAEEAKKIIHETRKARIENNFAARISDAFRGQA